MANDRSNSDMPPNALAAGLTEGPRFYLVGGGIASLSAAAFLIRDGGIAGSKITIFEELDRLGGSLDASGSPASGYVLRGGRMFEKEYRCTFDLFSSIPTVDDRCTVTQEIEQWNKTLKTSSKARLFEHGKRHASPEFGLSEAQILRLETLSIEPEFAIGDARISDIFAEDFFLTDFWIMWCTTFAFQPWHSAVEFKRYLVRFAHMVYGFSRLEGIMRTVFNQFDSMVRPLTRWLLQHGVIFRLNCCVTAIEIEQAGETLTAKSLSVKGKDGTEVIGMNATDFVFVTLGSMTEGSTLGSMTSPAPDAKPSDGSALKLWTQLAWGRPQFGRPETFFSHVDESKWISFTVTLQGAHFLDRLVELTGNTPGEGGLVTFKASNWLMSIVIPHQPHVIGQPSDVKVFWGYGLYVERLGNFVSKSMSDCSGSEIMVEILGHLGCAKERDALLEGCICIPCKLPFITSQFLPRVAGDRPDVRPKGSQNIALMGQYCELPDDVVFTVEYSIRSARNAVVEMLALENSAPPTYNGTHTPRVLYEALRTLHDRAA